MCVFCVFLSVWILVPVPFCSQNVFPWAISSPWLHFAKLLDNVEVRVSTLRRGKCANEGLPSGALRCEKAEFEFCFCCIFSWGHETWFSHLESKNNHTRHSVFLEGSVKEFKRHMKVFYKL